MTRRRLESIKQDPGAEALWSESSQLVSAQLVVQGTVVTEVISFVTFYYNTKKKKKKNIICFEQ